MSVYRYTIIRTSCCSDCQELCRAQSHSGFQRSSWSSRTCVSSAPLSDRPSSFSRCQSQLDRLSTVSIQLWPATAAYHCRPELEFQTVRSLIDRSVERWDARIRRPRRSVSSWVRSCAVGCRSSPGTYTTHCAANSAPPHRRSSSPFCSGSDTSTRRSTRSSTRCSTETSGTRSSKRSLPAAVVDRRRMTKLPAVGSHAPAAATLELGQLEI